MHPIVTLLMLTSLLFVSTDVHAESQVDVGISIGEGGLKGFYLSVGEYYRVPQQDRCNPE